MLFCHYVVTRLKGNTLNFERFVPNREHSTSLECFWRYLSISTLIMNHIRVFPEISVKWLTPSFRYGNNHVSIRFISDVQFYRQIQSVGAYLSFNRNISGL